MAVNNATILDKVWLSGTNDYQQRIPRAIQKDIHGNVVNNAYAVQNALLAPDNFDFYNQFVDGLLLNRIGRTIINKRRWENPLAFLKSENVAFGDTVQEIAIKLIKGKGYNFNADDMLKVNPPKTLLNLHKVNRQERYDISVSIDEVRKAFLSEYGLNELLSGILEVPITSDQYDEYRAMIQLMGEFESNNGFHKIQVPGTDDEDGAKALLKAIRATTTKLGILNGNYNASGIPTASKPEDLVLFATPDVIANIDVNVLAGAFNVSYADVKTRVIPIDEFPIAGAQAVLADKSWFRCYDYLYRNESFRNGSNLVTNYWLHHWEILSVSCFMNAVLFTTNAATQPQVITQTPTGLTVNLLDKDNTPVTIVSPGQVVKINGNLTGTISPENDNFTVQPDAVEYVITDANDSDVTSQFIKKDDAVGDQAVLVGQAVEDGDYTLTAKTTYSNPSGDTPDIPSATVTFTVSGSLIESFGFGFEDDEDDEDGDED